MRIFCPKCRKPVHIDWERCVYCKTSLKIKENKYLSKKGKAERRKTRSRLRLLHLTGTILVALVLILPYQVTEEISVGPPIEVIYG